MCVNTNRITVHITFYVYQPTSHKFLLLLGRYVPMHTNLLYAYYFCVGSTVKNMTKLSKYLQ